MVSASNQPPAIIRTEQGLAIAGTRITLYDILDHLKAGWTPKLIRHWLPLTEAQLDAALAFIDDNQIAVEAEYQTVLEETQARRKYWEDKYEGRLAQIANLPPKPGQEDIYLKLQAWKSKLGLTE